MTERPMPSKGKFITYIHQEKGACQSMQGHLGKHQVGLEDARVGLWEARNLVPAPAGTCFSDADPTRWPGRWGVVCLRLGRAEECGARPLARSCPDGASLPTLPSHPAAPPWPDWFGSPIQSGHPRGVGRWTAPRPPASLPILVGCCLELSGPRWAFGSGRNWGPLVPPMPLRAHWGRGAFMGSKLEYCFLKHQETRKYSIMVLNKKININKTLDIRDSKQTHSCVVW